MKTDDLEKMARQLDAHEDYRVVRRLQAQARYAPDPDDSSQLRQGLYLDVETTGLDAATDSIIQLALVPFHFTVDGQVCSVGDSYEEYDDPGCPIPEEITRLTGISDDDVRGKAINWQQVATIVEASSLVVAHNANFDRRFVETRCSAFEEKGWACTLREIPWREENLESSKLEFLAYRFGFFYDGHSAGIDSLAGIHLLAQKLPVSGQSVLSVLLDSARRTTYRLWALKAPFEAKDLLKARGYRWNGGEDGRHKAWYIEADQERCESEQQYLKNEIYKRDIQLPLDKITCFTRYSDRN